MVFPARGSLMEEERIGRIGHYWPGANAASVDLSGATLHGGDRVRIRGHGHDFIQEISSLEIEHERRSEGHPGENLAIHVVAGVHRGDEVLAVHRGAGKE